MIHRVLSSGFCVWAILLFLCSCTSLSWEKLEHGNAEGRAVQPSLIVLPTNESGGEEIRRRFVEYALARWPDIPMMTDTDFINHGAPVDRGVIVIGTKKGNRFLARRTVSLPIEMTSAGVKARAFHAGELALWMTLRTDVPIYVFTGTAPEAILSAEPQLEAEQDYLVLNGARIVETGYFRIASPARPLDSPMYAGQLRVVVPEDEKGPAGYGSETLTGREAMTSDFSGQSVLVRGTRRNNCFLDKLLENLPVTIENGAVIARGIHSGPDFILYAKVPPMPQGGTVRILAGTGEEVSGKFNFSSAKYNLNRFDYVVINSRRDVVVECGLYPGNEAKYILKETPPGPKEMMLDDFDRLAQFLEENLPAREAYKKVFGVNIPAILDKYRSEIKGDESPVDFFRIVRRMLQECKGDHLDIYLSDLSGSPGFADMTDGLSGPDGSSLRIFGKPAGDTAEVHSIYRKALSRDYFYAGPPMIYHDGEFYTAYDFRYDGRTYPRGMRLLDVNGENVSSILSSLQPGLQRWDWKRRMFYGTRAIGFEGDAFWDHLNIRNGDGLNLRFRKQDGEIVHVPYVVGKTISPVGRNLFSRAVMPDREVAFLKQSGILYIRLPAMRDADFYLKKIKLLNGHDIRAVVIDIRFNSGGNSETWIQILQALIAEPITIPLKRAVRDTATARNRYGWPERRERIEFLDDDYAVTDMSATISPDQDSLKLSVPIYVLVKDIFSASGQMAQFAARSDQLISVGERNPVPLGSPASPEFLYLPYSRMMVRFKFCIDVFDCASAEDVFQTRPEVELNPSLSDLLEYRNMDLSLPLEERLRRQDPYYKKVLELMTAVDKEQGK